ncbi:hypothetical protein E2C01_006415 [Portunus trituberculatus]|uniref:Uncharacterized protein n=1 Tax=Portunus trituberculatus TaxID=210409 RepID=A0A5B7CXU1_PORTR|nr:hypothetical protein [Portunus trituberculatus]
MALKRKSYLTCLLSGHSKGQPSVAVTKDGKSLSCLKLLAMGGKGPAWTQSKYKVCIRSSLWMLVLWSAVSVEVHSSWTLCLQQHEETAAANSEYSCQQLPPNLGNPRLLCSLYPAAKDGGWHATHTTLFLQPQRALAAAQHWDSVEVQVEGLQLLLY